jgi:hypothetical protein
VDALDDGLPFGKKIEHAQSPQVRLVERGRRRPFSPA